MGYLYNWVLSPDYVEVVIYFFTDGTHLVILDSMNTPNSSVIMMTENSGNYYYQGKQISKLAHTHSYSDNPSESDIAFKNQYPGIEHSIYYNGAFYYY